VIRWPLHLLATGLALLSGTTAGAVPAPPKGWNVYGNARFGYSLCYPGRLLRPQPEAENGDGRAFHGSHGVKLLAYGQYNALDRSLAEEQEQDRQRFVAEGGRIRYSARKGNWYVLSGRVGSQIFYLRSQLAGDRYISFELRYPAREAARWNPVVVRMSSCLKS
jgi:hypothetical protein